MNCKICETTLGPKARMICSNCNSKKHKIECIECKKVYDVTAHYFISLDANTHRCKRCKFKGKSNPNFGKRWSHEKRKKQSNNIKSRVDDVYRLNCSKGMKGKTVSEETIEKRKKVLLEKVINGWKKPEMTEQTKKLIGEKSAEKFTFEYLMKQRKINEDLGYWIPLDKLEDYKLYRELANWKTLVLNENIIGIDLLKKGKLKSKDHRGADSLVRDHMFGRKSGFDSQVFPEILRHPANCQIITHSENIKKAKSNKDCVISLDNLFNRILNWNLEYNEHTICLELIEKHKDGLRYNKENYIKDYYVKP
jgi:hypothetical protein